MVHLTLFLIMIIYLVSVVVLVVVGEQIRRRWYRWEQVDGADITLLMNNFADDLCYRESRWPPRALCSSEKRFRRDTPVLYRSFTLHKSDPQDRPWTKVLRR